MKKQAISVLFATVAMGIASAQAAELVVNGSFETGDFSGWTTSVANNSNGSLVVTNGPTAPDSGAPLPGATDGAFQAVTGQSGPGTYSLTQTVALPTGITSAILSFDFFANTDVGLIDNGTLDHTGTPNQHARVDILVAGADPFSTNPGDILASIVAPTVTGALFNGPGGYSSFSVDVSGVLSGLTSVVLRFGQTDNQGFFTMGVDNVSLDVNAGEVPVPAAALLFAPLAAGFIARRRK
ncbi:MAG: hypothetical protein AAF830_15585 [Pseudomonadota bacterium]